MSFGLIVDVRIIVLRHLLISMNIQSMMLNLALHFVHRDNIGLGISFGALNCSRVGAILVCYVGGG